MLPDLSSRGGYINGGFRVCQDARTFTENNEDLDAYGGCDDSLDRMRLTDGQEQPRLGWFPGGRAAFLTK